MYIYRSKAALTKKPPDKSHPDQSPSTISPRYKSPPDNKPPEQMPPKIIALRNNVPPSPHINLFVSYFLVGGFAPHQTASRGCIFFSRLVDPSRNRFASTAYFAIVSQCFACMGMHTSKSICQGAFCNGGICPRWFIIRGLICRGFIVEHLS